MKDIAIEKRSSKWRVGRGGVLINPQRKLTVNEHDRSGKRSSRVWENIRNISQNRQIEKFTNRAAQEKDRVGFGKKYHK